MPCAVALDGHQTIQRLAGLAQRRPPGLSSPPRCVRPPPFAREKASTGAAPRPGRWRSLATPGRSRHGSAAAHTVQLLLGDGERRRAAPWRAAHAARAHRLRSDRLTRTLQWRACAGRASMTALSDHRRTTSLSLARVTAKADGAGSAAIAFARDCDRHSGRRASSSAAVCSVRMTPDSRRRAARRQRTGPIRS